MDKVNVLALKTDNVVRVINGVGKFAPVLYKQKQILSKLISNFEFEINSKLSVFNKENNALFRMDESMSDIDSSVADESSANMINDYLSQLDSELKSSIDSSEMKNNLPIETDAS